MALITSTEYKTYAGISDTSLDGFLAIAVPSAQEILEALCGRPSGGFESATQNEFWDGSETRCYYVKCWPVTAVASVSEVDSEGNLTAMNAAEYVISPDTKAVCRSGARMMSLGVGLDDVDRAFAVNQTGIYPQFLEGCKNYKVTYTGGYATVPYRLKWACYKLIDDMVSARREASDKKSESIGDYSYTRGVSPATITDVQSLISDWMVDIS
jgi:hypothetical protein